jgi:tRNA nucleotidyltransferase/poly(A) polymerase
MNKKSYVSSEHSTALMRWLSKATKSLGREVAKNTYVVGGAVRNFKLKQPIKDVDIVLDAITLGKNSAWLAEELAVLIPAETETMSDQYGVAKVWVKSEWLVGGLDLSEFSAEGDAAIEIVDARAETYSDDTGGGYKPTIEKSTIREDIFRRDFTFNTLMWRLSDLANGPDQAEIIDITGCGLDDLEAGEARCPLDPERTFHDDPTRILRAVKFLVKYGLTIPKDTAKAIKKTKWSLLKVHYNRVYTEVEKLLNERSWKKSLSIFHKLGIMEVLSELANREDGFRSALATKAKTLPYMFFIELLGFGLPIKHTLSFLNSDQIDRMRDLSILLTKEEQEDLVKALKSPGSALKDKKFLPSLARQKGVAGGQVGAFMSRRMTQLRSLYLETPNIIYDPQQIKSNLMRDLSVARVASRHIATRLTLQASTKDSLRR